MSEEKPIAEVWLLETFKAYEHFSRVFFDAYALVSAAGKIVKCNQLFSQLVAKTTKQVLKTESFSELLRFSLGETELKLEELLEHRAPTRLDEVIGETLHNQEKIIVILGVYPFFGGSDGCTFLGTFIVIRDVTAEKGLQDKYTKKAIQSITDPLTGLYTRAYFDEYLDSQSKALGETHEEHSPKMSILMIDIDFFKRVNDQYGHQAGDYVIKEVAAQMRKSFRKTDIPCRYGGEEFLVVLPGTDISGAILAAQKVRKAVESQVFRYDAKLIPITISIGVAQLDPKKEMPSDTIARSDAALYHSKRSGRNRVSINTGDENKVDDSVESGPVEVYERGA